ncbi:SRPBCC domain-containing protein [uncultured Eudoraea sp.]|uniref:SRPBCC family protein n=1 Tax=uncultured Eudoraea sp. TaxID=1035614 RepID=UPI002638986D|nr:SRPBCC domain-containing protein [uncultured Eudoraea sp.]
MSNTNEFNNRTLTIERTYNAPIQLVWDAWTQAEQIALWWGPKGMQTKVIQHDFKVGGIWKYVMIMPDGNEFITEGVYSEIAKQEKIVSSADFKPMTEGVEIQALFEAKEDKTNFTFKVVHPTAEYCRQQEKMGFYKGWNSTFDRLNEYLKTQ